ncbi:MAG TPA: phosphatidate cytidylyltransferase [Pirellulaceae bacterium]|nr:phosphatidate cytidylyltransferase [Pirellulaceae bacterium]HMO93130.1 phosphatidate cytidylyltransferase [Pirellulaceae bacterium]HMP70311.1 phosphatidate cytidylyltransferase [Pirellulaceae bacterium]
MSRLVAFLFDTSQFSGPSMTLLGGNLLVLAVLFAVGRYLRKQSESMIDPAVIRSFDRRIVGWIAILVILVLALMVNRTFTLVFFGFLSFWALREFITMTPTRRGDHRTLFWVFFLFTPLQYFLVALQDLSFLPNLPNRERFAELFIFIIPVYASLFVAGRIAFADDAKRYLERIAKIQFGLLICVFAISHAPALLYLEPLRTFNAEANAWEIWTTGTTTGLLLYFVIIVQISDLLHFVWDRMAGRHVIAPSINANRTWEGLTGSACCTLVIGMFIQAVMPITPFQIVGSGLMACLISVMASSGSMTMSAIKRDRGVQDFGTLVQGHAGILDRIDSICFAAPIFFHVTRFFLATQHVPGNGVQ